MLEENKPDLKKTTARLKIPVDGNQPVAMKLYIGPNEYENLAAFDVAFQEIIPYGRSIFGTVNRWIIRAFI